MSMLSDAKLLIEALDKIKENLGLNNIKANPSGSIFNSLEIRRGSIATENKDIIKPIVTKAKKYYFRISFLKNSIQFLDIKSILNLSLVNKEFGYFIKSIYFYKFMSNVNNSRKLKKRIELNTNKSDQNKKSQPSTTHSSNRTAMFGLGNFVGALGSVLGISSSKQTVDTKEKKIDPKLLEEKINIYEKILYSKLKSSKISKEMKDLRENIDSLIAARIKKKESNKINKFNYNHMLKDEEIEKIKREKMESEFTEFKSDVEVLQAEVKIFILSLYLLKQEKLKFEIEILQKEEIEKEKILASLNIYIKNNLKVEELKITPRENLKSGKFGDLEGDVATMALLNSFINK